ncbi:Lrp/AsnC family transcriptional regulator [Geoglobus sp.]
MENKNRLTKKDLLILRHLHGEKMPGYTDISIRTGLPESTVRYRIERMEKMGVIKGYSAIVDPHALGFHMAIVIGNDLPPHGIFFNTIGSVGSVTILLGEYKELYNGIIHDMRKDADIREVLPVISTNTPITTWSIHNILKQ